MKIINQKNLKLYKYITYALALTFAVVAVGYFSQWFYNMVETAFIKEAYIPVTYKAPAANMVEYKYNEQVPEEAILLEMKSLAERFSIDPVKWEKLLRNEATCTQYNIDRHGCTPGELDNLAENPKSTACGLGQWLVRTWRETESWKQYKIACTDYKASLWEQALDLSSGQSNKWDESNVMIGIYNYMK